MKTTIKIIVGLAGGLLALMFIILAIHDRSPIFAAKALVVFLVAATIIRAINRTATSNLAPGSSDPSSKKMQRNIAIGLAIGSLGSIALFKTIIWWLERK